jgi:chitin synthase
MYPPGPPQRPPHGEEEFERYPLETRFNEQQPVLQQSPFEDYVVEEHAPPLPVYEDQPLLQTSQPVMSPPRMSPSIPMPFPDHGPYSSVPTNEPYPQYPPADMGESFGNNSPDMYFTGAPRRQPRRYKTSKKCLTI